MSEELDQKAFDDMVDRVNNFLVDLPDDTSRYKFLAKLKVCLLCGSLDDPCYCSSIYDE